METLLQDNEPELQEFISLDQFESQLQSMLLGRIRGLRLSWRDGRVSIHGQARTYHSKQLAQETVLAIADVEIAANEIEIFP